MVVVMVGDDEVNLYISKLCHRGADAFAYYYCLLLTLRRDLLKFSIIHTVSRQVTWEDTKQYSMNTSTDG